MSKTMSSRERVLATLGRKPPDRPAADIWTTPEIMGDLKRHFMVESENDVYERLGVDKIAWVRAPHLDAGDESLERRDEWGVTHRWVRFGAGRYEEVARKTEWFCMLSFISIFEVYCALKPMDEALMDLYLNPDFAHSTIGHIMEVQRGYLRRTLDAIGSDIDLVYLSDDMGMQDRPLMSLEMWREFFKEPYAELISTVHDRGCYAFYHTDGSAFDIVADLVGLGIDVLNPIQHRCPGMDRERLFDAFGDRVVFHGAGGGYIVAPCHMIQAGTPVENIVAMYEAAKEAG